MTVMKRGDDVFGPEHASIFSRIRSPLHARARARVFVNNLYNKRMWYRLPDTNSGQLDAAS